MRLRAVGGICVLLAMISAGIAQERANTDPTYQQLRHITSGSEAISVSNFILKRNAGTFTFKTGTFFLLAPVAG